MTATSTRKRRNGLAAFRALELEVEAALAQGRTVLSIYEEKRDRLAMSYAQFARYAQPLRRALKCAPNPRPASAGFLPLPVLRRRSNPGLGGPPRGRPEDAMPALDMDTFAAQVLSKRDLY